MQTASTHGAQNPATLERENGPVNGAVRAFDAFVEDCITLARLSIINTLDNADGLKADTFDIGVSIAVEHRQRLMRSLRGHKAIGQLKSRLYRHRLADSSSTRPAARMAVSAPLGLATPSMVQTGQFLKQLVQEPHVSQLVLRDRFGLGSTSTSGASKPRNASVQLCLNQIKCLDDTREIDQDEIAFGGVAIGPDGTVKKVNEQQVPVKFKRAGDVYTFNPPHTLHTYDLLSAPAYPLGLVFELALSEKDNGGFASFLEELWKSVKAHVDAILVAVGAAAGAAVGAQIGGSIGTLAGPIGTIIGLALGAIVGGIVGIIINSFKDDIFSPQELALALAGPTATFGDDRDLTSNTESRDFIGHGGHYRVSYSWKLKQVAN